LPEPATRATGSERGDADLVIDLRQRRQSLEARGISSGLDAAITCRTFISMNNQSPPFDNANVPPRLSPMRFAVR